MNAENEKNYHEKGNGLIERWYWWFWGLNTLGTEETDDGKGARN